MTHDQLSAIDITSHDEFEAVLAEAVEKAWQSDADARGAWEFRTHGPTHDWEVEITELVTDSAETDE